MTKPSRPPLRKEFERLKAECNRLRQEVDDLRSRAAERFGQVDELREDAAKRREELKTQFTRIAQIQAILDEERIAEHRPLEPRPLIHNAAPSSRKW